MPTFRIKEAAGLLGVSDDTLRHEAADELGLEPRMLAGAAVKATKVTRDPPNRLARSLEPPARQESKAAATGRGVLGRTRQAIEATTR
jgi:hypothetical protein